MALSRATMLARMLAADPGSDGRFLTGVLTTGVYCLPSCRARKPRPENVVFHRTPEQARSAGLRACKRCRPDAYYAGLHADETLTEGLVQAMTLDPGSKHDAETLARHAGVSVSKLYDLFRTHYHTTPAELLTRLRVAAARRALLDGGRTTAQIAFEVGFGSLSAFGAAFRGSSAMTPQAFRRLNEFRFQESPPHTDLRFDLTLPDDYPAAATLQYLGRDAASLSERVQDQTFTAAMPLDSGPLTVEVVFAVGRAHCRVNAGRPLDQADLLQLHARLLGLLGLHSDPGRFERQVATQPDLAPLILGQAGLRVPLIPDPFDGLLWAIAGQQVTLAFACTLRRRLTECWGERLPSGLYAPPTAQSLAVLEPGDLLPLGFPRARAATLIGAARAVAGGQLPLADLAGQSATRAERTLLAVPGIGPWSAHYQLMRVYGFADNVPLGDSGLGESLKRFFGLERRPSPAETLRLMKRFAPYRSLATFHLWRRLHAQTR